jgi:transposase InsO family protein
MVTNNQVRRLKKLMQTEKTFGTAAAKAGMDEKTARKYAMNDKLPSEMEKEHTWRTREDPFEEIWEEVRSKLDVNPGLEAKTLFGYLQRKYTGKFADGQLRTLQRRVKTWRALEGPPKEVFFPQEHHPGQLSQSDFTYMNALQIRIGGMKFNHLVYHFVLTYSNWEAGTICFSESFESLSEGLQDALWELGGVPKEHQTDRLSAAVCKTVNPEEFTMRYSGLLRHYGIKGRKIQTGKPNENGDVEQLHYRFKKAVDQSLLLRGSRNFSTREEYEQFLRNLFKQLNAGRRKRFEEEQGVLRRLPRYRLNAYKRLKLRVGPSSTIRANHNVYSVDSRLIGEYISIRLYAKQLEVWYAQKCIEKIPRLRGEGKHYIQYRHIIEWLVRKPGAFENYRYRQDLFPTYRFRIAYDALKKSRPAGASKEYLRILHLAARENEAGVDEALNQLIEGEKTIAYEAVEAIVASGAQYEAPKDVRIDKVDVRVYDELLSAKVVV